MMRKSIPVAVRWNLLSRCVSRCEYCNLWKRSSSSDELTTSQIKDGLEQLAALGATRISFSGGEPLLRPDIGEIVSYAAKLGISPSMNSSGFFLEQRIDSLADLDLLKISLDGPESIHNRTRGREDAFFTAMSAAKLAKERLRKISFATTITRFNVNSLQEILSIAERFDAVVAFQPIKSLYKGVENTRDLEPSPLEMQAAVARLIESKKSGNPYIRNSLAELRHIALWPTYPNLPCGAGKIFLMIDSDGTILPCDRIRYATPLPNLRDTTIQTALTRLPDVHCAGCGFCGSLQLNMIYSLNFRPLLDVLYFVR